MLWAAGSAETAAQTPQPRCGPLAALTEFLKRKFEERVVVVGVEQRGNMMMLYANPKTTTWTMVISAPNEIACAVGAGEGYLVVTPSSDGDTGM